MAMTQRQALDLWRCALTAYVRSDESDMTARQQAVLMPVALTPGPHTVRGLSNHLSIAKPAVTRALDVLERNHFIKRIPDENDLRSVHIGSAPLAVVSRRRKPAKLTPSPTLAARSPKLFLGFQPITVIVSPVR